MLPSNRKKELVVASLSILMGLLVISAAIAIRKSGIKLDQKNPDPQANGLQGAMQYDADFYINAFSFVRSENSEEKKIIAAIVPHHLLAADLIARVYNELKDQDYETIVLLGPDHYSVGKAGISTTKKNWQTPFGILENDTDVAEELLKDEAIQIDDQVFGNEHAIYNQIGFIKKTFPRAKIVPLILKSQVSTEQALRLALILNDFRDKKDILVLVSADFSHNTDSQTAIDNDKNSLEIINNFDYPSVIEMAVDTPPSIYVLMKYVESREAAFTILDNSNSALLSGQPGLPNITSYITGYYSISQ